jgi:hypothetical protein
MNWYKKSMPIKRVKMPPKEDFDYEWQHESLEKSQERIDSKITEDIEDPLGELNPVGAGGFGVAYYPTSNPNMIVKYTDHTEEYEVAQKIMKWQQANGGFHPHIVGIYSAEILPYKGDWDTPVVRLVMERVQPFDSDITKIREQSPAPKMDDQKTHEYMEDFENELEKQRLYLADMHEGNFGYRASTGEKVVLDIGHLGGKGLDIKIEDDYGFDEEEEYEQYDQYGEYQMLDDEDY